MTTRTLALAIAAALAACSHPKPEADARPVPERTGALVPVTVAWLAGAGDAGSLSLTAQLAVAPNLVEPLEVTVAVPAGVTLTRGAASFHVLPGQSGTLTYAYAFSVAPGASGEIVLRADITKEGAGLHAKAAWAVGAAAAQRTAPAVPSATGPAVKVLGKDLGPSVPLR